MKKVILLTLFSATVLLSGSGIYAQETRDQQPLIKDIQRQVTQINTMELRRIYLSWSQWMLYRPEYINEWLNTLYFDQDGSLRKTKSIYSFPEGTGYHFRYFDSNGVCIYSTFGCSSGHDGDHSIAVYRDGNREWVWLDYLEYEGDGWPVLIQDNIRNGFYFTEELSELPGIGKNLSGFFRDAEELMEHWSVSFQEEPMTIPESYAVVRFCDLPADTVSSVIYNRVPIYKKPSENSELVGELRISNIFKIIGTKGDWYRIEHTEHHYNGATQDYDLLRQTGYVRKDCVEPGEKEITVVVSGGNREKDDH